MSYLTQRRRARTLAELLSFISSTYSSTVNRAGDRLFALRWGRMVRIQTLPRSSCARVVFIDGSRNVIAPLISLESVHFPSMTKSLCHFCQGFMSRMEIVSFRLGISTFVGTLADARRAPALCLAILCLIVKESILATREQGRSPSSKRKLDASHFFCLGPAAPVFNFRLSPFL